MSMFSGMQVNDEVPKTTSDDAPPSSGFSFINANAARSTPPPISNEEEGSTQSAGGPSAFSFIGGGSVPADPTPQPHIETTSASEAGLPPPMAATVPVVPALPRQEPGAVKKKKRAPRNKPGHARDEQLGTMPLPSDPTPPKVTPPTTTTKTPGTTVAAGSDAEPTVSTAKSPSVQTTMTSRNTTATEKDSAAPERTGAGDEGTAAKTSDASTNGPRSGVSEASGAGGRKWGGRPRTNSQRGETSMREASGGSGREPPTAAATAPSSSGGNTTTIGKKFKNLFGFGRNAGSASSGAKASPKEQRRSLPADESPPGGSAVHHNRQGMTSRSQTGGIPLGTGSHTRSPGRRSGGAGAVASVDKSPTSTRGGATDKNPTSTRGGATDKNPTTDADAAPNVEHSRPHAADATTEAAVRTTPRATTRTDPVPPPSEEVEVGPTEPRHTREDTDEDESIAQVSIATVANAREEVSAKVDTFNATDDEQAMLLGELNAQLARSVQSRRLLKEKLATLDEAVAQEDYDLCATLEVEIDELKTELDSTEDGGCDRDAVRAALLELLSRKRALWGDESDVHQAAVDKLQSSIHAQEEEMRTFELELDAATADEKADLDDRQSKLNRARGHLKLDREHLQDQVNRYRKLADEKTAAFVKEKARLETTQDTVRARIAEIRSELKRLEIEDDDLSRGIRAQEERIVQAESGLSVEKGKMDAEAVAIEASEAQLDHDQQELDLARARLDENTAGFREQHDELALSLEQSRAYIADALRRKGELAACEASMQDFLKSYTVLFDPQQVMGGGEGVGGAGEDGHALAGEGGLASPSKVGTLRREVHDATARVQSLTSSVLEKQSESSALRKQLEDLENRLPELERAKKLAVSGRNFKEAARIANEIKAHAASEAERKEALQNLNAALLTETENLDEEKTKLTALQEELTSCERVYDMGALDQLKDKSRELRSLIREHAAVNIEIAKLVKADCITCELYIEQLSIKHDLDWTPPDEDLDDIIADAIAHRSADGTEVLLSFDDQPAAPAVDLLGGPLDDVPMPAGGVETTDEGGDAGEDHSESPAVPVDVAAESADDESNGGETENVASGDVTETDDVTENDGEDEVASDPTADDAGDASPEENAGDVATEENAGDVEAEENGGDVATEENAVDVTEDDTGTVVDADGEAAAAANALQELDAHIDALQAQVDDAVTTEDYELAAELEEQLSVLREQRDSVEASASSVA